MEPTKERLLSVVFRLNDVKLRSLKQLAQRTRIRQSEYLREAIADLLSKYDDKRRGGGP
ncbi:MAG: ribbon-helix-helix domain-containing protein [Cystobacterineae bacterium]|nr:ribbon-helix-helix domain-containing protein [Cystobacterineae bacterium]